MSDQPSAPDVQIDEAETVNVTQSVGEPAPESEATEVTDTDSGSSEDS